MLGFSGLVFIGLGGAAKVLPEIQLWPFWATRPEADMPLTEGIPLSRAEFLMSAVAHPHGTDGRACAVEARVGSLSKRLLVHGDRYWEGAKPSAPEPFTSMPLTWKIAFGGEGFPGNPVGTGTSATERNGVRLPWLPNVEDPRQPFSSPRDRPSPAGFGPIDPMWPERLQHQGTYDEAWLKTQFPAIAADTRWQGFNRAPGDQQQAEPFTGTEEYAFQNLHPTLPVLKGQLPGLKVRAFVTQRAGGVEKFKEIRTHLNTLWFFPDAERAVLVFQGMHEVTEDDGADIVHLLTALEYLGQPRPAEHYLHVRDKRLDKNNGAIESLREDDLAPADLAVPLVDFSSQENRAFERGQKRAENERAKTRAEVASHGLDPDEHAPPLKGEPPPEVRNIDDLIRLRTEMDARMASMQGQAASEKARVVADVKAVLDREGQDFKLIEREMAGLETRGPPKPFADDLLRSFRGFIAAGQSSEVGKAAVAELGQMVVDKQLHAGWRSQEASQLKGYRMTAHYQTPIDRASGAAAQALRQRVMAQRTAGGDFVGWDLSGADLSGLDLAGANLDKALMERVNLTGTNLSGAHLRDAVLAHADLVSTTLKGAILTRANMGSARIEKADFEGADLTEAIFAKSVLTEVSWRGARLDDTRFENASMRSIDCGGAFSGKSLIFNQADLRGFSFAGARLRAAAFIECDVRGVDFSGAVFEKCAFVTLRAMGARFGGLRVDSGSFARECDLSGTDFSGAILLNMSFRGARLPGAQLRGAQLSGSDFSECDLSGADLSRSDARAARFVRANLAGANFSGANLMDAIFQHAALQDTDYRQANLFQSDFARVRVAPGVRFDGALTSRMRIYPRHRENDAGGFAP